MEKVRWRKIDRERKTKEERPREKNQKMNNPIRTKNKRKTKKEKPRKNDPERKISDEAKQNRLNSMDIGIFILQVGTKTVTRIKRYVYISIYIYI